MKVELFKATQPPRGEPTRGEEPEPFVLNYKNETGGIFLTTYFQDWEESGAGLKLLTESGEQAGFIYKKEVSYFGELKVFLDHAAENPGDTYEFELTDPQ